jgi:Flp pilus assembly protein TadD
MTTAKADGACRGPEASSDGALPTLEALAHLIHRGSEALRDGKTSEAEHAFERALRLYPENPTTRHLLALAWLRSGRLERALAMYESTLREHPESSAARVNVAVVLLKLGRASAARPLLEEVVKRRPDHRRAWGYLGATLEQLGDIADAESAFIAGHFANAAKRLRERHPDAFTTIAMIAGERSAPAPVPAFPRRTVAMEPGGSSAAWAAGALAQDALPRFAATLRPPDLVQPEHDSVDTESGGSHDGDAVDEIAFEETIAPPAAPPTLTLSSAPKPLRPVAHLLDAALRSLLVVPREADVVAHPMGLVLAGLVEDPEAVGDGGFAARSDVIHALGGRLRRESLPRRPSPTPTPFRESAAPFTRVMGNGQLMLAPPQGGRLLPLEMDADVVFVREELIVGFDHALLYDLGRLRRPSGHAVSLVRFRGDGVIVLALGSPFLSFDVHGEDALTLRATTLVGWIGALTPEPIGEDDWLTFAGEGTVLFRAPHDS